MKQKTTTKKRAARLADTQGAADTGARVMADTQMHLDYMMPIVEMELRAMSEAAKNGDEKAVAALHQIAFKAAGVLNGLGVSTLREVAKSVEWWPVNLSWVASYNRTNLLHYTEVLGLGKDVSSIFDMEAVLKRGAPTNWMGCYLVQFVEECRRCGMLLKSLWEHWSNAGVKAMTPDDEALLVQASNKMRLRTAAVASLMNLELPQLTQDEVDSEMSWTLSKITAALPLRPLLESRESREEWFEFGMELVRELSNGSYEKPEYGLKVMNRKPGATTAGRLRAGIRQGIKEGFEAVIAAADPAGFVTIH